MPTSILSKMRWCIFSTMRAALRMYLISVSLLTARCQLTSAVASTMRAFGRCCCSEAKAAAENHKLFLDRRRVVEGKSVSECIDIGCDCIIKQENKKKKK